MQFGISFLVQEISEEYVSSGKMLQFLSFSLVSGECPIFEINYDRIPPPREVSRRNTSSSDLWMLGFRMYSTRISRLNWKSTADVNVAKESVWLFSDLGT